MQKWIFLMKITLESNMREPIALFFFFSKRGFVKLN